jgi:hypothetical protein
LQEHQGLLLTNVDDVTQDQPKEPLINSLSASLHPVLADVHRG